MNRYTTFIALTILAASIFSLFQVKFHVQSLRSDIVELNKQLKNEQQMLHVLKAEWTHLNQPERLKQLAAKHSKLSKVKLEQMHKMDSKLPIYLTEDNEKKELYLASIELNKHNKNHKKLTPNHITTVSKPQLRSEPSLTKVKY